MTNAVARIMFAITVLLLVPVLAFLWFSSRPAPDTGMVVAQFEDAFPLVEGMNVRVEGAIAGSVGPIEVNDQGFAEVTLLLDDEIEKPRADASASIRQQDTTGDSYVAFAPGKASKPLREVDGHPTIRCFGDRRAERCPGTLVAPRLDDLLNAFGSSERAGIQLTLTELARAVDGRGKDLNRAALDLRPGLAAANRALDDVNRQNAALRSVIADAENVTGQAASRSRSLTRAIDGLAGTLSATAAETQSLDAGLRRLPATAARARTTLAALTRAAMAGRPLARELRDGAPLLATATERAPEFLSGLRAFLGRTRPTLDFTHRLLKDATPTIEAEPSRVVTGPFDLAPAISNMLRGVLGEDETIEVLFNEKFGLGAAASEPGNQMGYPAEHKDRRFLRTTMVLNCEGFGVPVRPGCLLDALGAMRARDGDRGSRRKRSSKRRRRDTGKREGRGGSAGATEQRAPAAPGPSSPVSPTLPQLPSVPLPAPPTPPDDPGKPSDPAPDEAVRDLLDFLLG